MLSNGNYLILLQSSTSASFEYGSWGVDGVVLVDHFQPERSEVRKLKCIIVSQMINQGVYSGLLNISPMAMGYRSKVYSRKTISPLAAMAVPSLSLLILMGGVSILQDLVISTSRLFVNDTHRTLLINLPYKA